MRIGALVAAAAGTMMIVSAEAEPIVLSPDKSIPVRVDAKRVTMHEKGKSATFSDAQIFQGDTHWQCKTLNVRYDDAKAIQQFECEP